MQGLLIPCVHAGTSLTVNNFIACLSVLSKQICSTLLTRERKINLFLYSKVKKHVPVLRERKQQTEVQSFTYSLHRKGHVLKGLTSQENNPAQLNSSVQHIPKSHNISKDTLWSDFIALSGETGK